MSTTVSAGYVNVLAQATAHVGGTVRSGSTAVTSTTGGVTISIKSGTTVVATHTTSLASNGTYATAFTAGAGNELKVGCYTVTAAYAGDSTYAKSTVTNTTPLCIRSRGTAIAMTLSPTTIKQGTQAHISADITYTATDGSTKPVPSGTVRMTTTRTTASGNTYYSRDIPFTNGHFSNAGTWSTLQPWDYVTPRQYPITLTLVAAGDYASSSNMRRLTIDPVDTWKPTGGIMISDPMGGSAYSKYKIYWQIVDMVKHSPRGSYIRMASYTYDGPDLYAAIAAAHKRGVNVQILANQNIVTDMERQLKTLLGTDRSKSSFFYICVRACRNGNYGNEHAKIVGFARTGAVNGVVMTASVNISPGSSLTQWGDSYTIYNNDAAYKTFLHIFTEMRSDTRPTDWPGVSVQPTWQVKYIFPRIVRTIAEMPQVTGGAGIAPAVTPADWAEAAIAQIGCNASSGYGINGHTKVRVMMYGLQGARGQDIANQLVKLRRAGCDVSAILSLPSSNAAYTLLRGGVMVRDMTWRWGKRTCTCDGTTIVYGPQLYSHLKAIAVSGNVGGKQLNEVFSGSDNWAESSYFNDEQVLRFYGTAATGVYMNLFSAYVRLGYAHDFIDWSHNPYAEPTGTPGCPNCPAN